VSKLPGGCVNFVITNIEAPHPRCTLYAFCVLDFAWTPTTPNWMLRSR